MSSLFDSHSRKEFRSIHIKLYFAYLIVLWESLWPALTPAFGGLLFFCGLVWLDVLPFLPGWIHAFLLFGIAGGFLVACRIGACRFAWPEQAAVRRRVEIENQFAHRPLAAVTDRLATRQKTEEPDPIIAQTWQHHLFIARQQLKGMKRPTLRFDPLTPIPLLLRVSLLLFLTVAIAKDGFNDSTAKLVRALQPYFTDTEQTKLALDAWITPPAYTGLAPIFLIGGRLSDSESIKNTLSPDETLSPDKIASKKTITIPSGSLLTARLQGSPFAPSLQINTDTQSFETTDTTIHTLKAILTQGSQLTIQHKDQILIQWPITIIADLPPEIELTAPPGRTKQLALRLDYKIKDDYGVQTARAILEQPHGAFKKSGNGSLDRANDPIGQEESEELFLLLPTRETKVHQGQHYADLTAHPWAGTGVMLSLEASDTAEQIGRSDSVLFVMPERIFNHPVARALIAQRKKLTTLPEPRAPIIYALDLLAGMPPHYQYDKIVFLAIHAAANRLRYDETPESIREVQQLLWDTALRLEDGDLSLANRELRAIQQALQEALAREDSSNAEIQQLMDQLAAVMERFLQAMQQKIESDDRTNLLNFDPAAIMDPQNFQNILEQARKMAQTGARKAAGSMLNELQNMLENLQNQPRMAQMTPQQRKAMEMLQKLQDLNQQQHDLLDRTFRTAQHNRSGSIQRNQLGSLDQKLPNGQSEQNQSGAGQKTSQRKISKDIGAEQETLRRMLDQMTQQLSETTNMIPHSMGRAERAMHKARDLLQMGIPDKAIPHQNEALTQLQQSLESMGQQMMQAFGGMFGITPSNRSAGTQRDPLGRMPGIGQFGTNNTGIKIPTEPDLQRTREILYELHRRASQPNRPQNERNYIDRLLNRF